MKGLSKFIKWFIFSICTIIAGLFFMSVFPEYAQNIVIATILIVTISGASIGVFLGRTPIYVDREQVQKDLQEARKFRIEPWKRIAPLVVGLFLIGIAFVAIKFIGDFWLSTNLMW